MTLEERVNEMEVQIAKHSERISKLEEWQAKQNGSLQRLEAKMDKIQQWLIGLLGSVIASLILLLINISIGK